MKILSIVAAIAGVLLCLAQPTFAAEDPAPLIGRWIDKLPNGFSMITEFSAKQVTFQGMDPEGKGTPPTIIGVQYAKSAPNTFRVDVDGQEPMSVTVQDGNTLMLQFPGMAPRKLVRYQPAAPRAH